MQPQEESVQEILKGLEGLEMLTQWELALCRDLRAKTEAILRSVHGDEPPGTDPPR